MDPYTIFLLSWEREKEIRREVNNPHRFNRIYEDKAVEPEQKGTGTRWFIRWLPGRRKEQPCEG